MGMKVEILDCTLRDGGYLNDWIFGRETICSLLSNLSQAGIDYIECGFLKKCIYSEEKTFFNSVVDLQKYTKSNQKYTLMINYGEYPLENLPFCSNKNIKIRVAFKKHNQNEALDYISRLKMLNWDVIANPMSTNTYTHEELSNLISKVNKIAPYAITIVDTLGNMYEQEVVDIFSFIDSQLNMDIALGFHSHNSMQLSFSNTKALLKMRFNRTLIVDSCLYGMGRGAGNLCTELIAKYLNDISGKNYKILPVLKTIDEYLKPIYEKSPWGYSTPYYIAAIHGCHPNYAGYLASKNLTDEKIDKIISIIPEENKVIYDENLIKRLLINNESFMTF